MAPRLCNPLYGGIVINTMMSAPRSRPDDCAQILYDSEGNVDRGGIASEWDLSANCYLVFAKNKRALQRGLTYRNGNDAFAPDGYMSIVKQNYHGLGRQYLSYAILPLHALVAKLKADWSILQQAGGLFRQRTNEIYDFERDTTTVVKAEPLQYTSYAFTTRGLRRVAAARSGYYVLICQSRDIVDDYDIVGKRCYTLPQRRINLPGISTLIDT